MKGHELKRFLHTYRRILILMLTPIILSPIIIAIDSQESRCAYAIGIMAVFWVTEVTPLAVTSLLPLIIFPFLGVLKAKEVCTQYMKDTTILMLAGLLIALAIEKWNVHKRVALIVLLLVGTQPRRLMLGFMLVTAFISMWISNTATTAMMTPIMEAVLKQLDKDFENHSLEDVEEETGKSTESTDGGNLSICDKVNYNATDEKIVSFSSTVTLTHLDENDADKRKKLEDHKKLCKAMLLCICYSANIGGTGTLTGTAPQLVLSGQVDEVFPDGPSISFIYWFIYACPQMILFLFIAWLYLQTMFIGIGFKHLCCCFRGDKRNKNKGKEMYAIMKKQYNELGKVTYAEINVLFCFILLVLLWFFREPKFMPGWGTFINEKYVSDSTAAMIVGFLLFQLPSQVPECLNFKNTPRKKLKSKTILGWKSVSEKFPWNVLFLLGAGFTLAQACQESGLSLYLSCQLSGLRSIPQAAIVFIVCTMLTFLTEFTSNIATATILLPILASMGQSIEVHPYYLMIPAAVCSSFAFMLPVATPPNAIVFATGRLTVADMAKAGFGMNIIGILIVTLCINTYGHAYYGLGEFPDWAMTGNGVSKCGGGLQANTTTNRTMF